MRFRPLEPAVAVVAPASLLVMLRPQPPPTPAMGVHCLWPRHSGGGRHSDVSPDQLLHLPRRPTIVPGSADRVTAHTETCAPMRNLPIMTGSILPTECDTQVLPPLRCCAPAPAAPPAMCAWGVARGPSAVRALRLPLRRRNRVSSALLLLAFFMGGSGLGHRRGPCRCQPDS